jgi:hypothetical protein
MPLYGVNPALEIEIVLDALYRVWIVYRGVDIVGLVVVGYRLVEDRPTHFCKTLHFNMIYNLRQK